MRVISGSAKGRRLKSLPGSSTRPITDRVKTALFDILGPSISGARVLDLFAGTGSVGIEALSRGAAGAVFVEKDPRAIRVLRENLQQTGLLDRARVIRADVFAFLRSGPVEPFDFIYVAPPQYRGWWRRTLELLDARPGWLAASGIIVVQIHPREFEEVPLHHLHRADRRDYGSTHLLFYRHLERRGQGDEGG
ncbi:Ribosomal RNA small subunit methyltransferase D [Candidatus Thermoflexus japonica]|uniref:Ribosomal RNA small subunit methyltransferase D n=1 Tax=Candidatus Thermoflexus japonica TaxID=2035417 RepID=A0A2H5Y8I6_9CHLR|nr:Ribosomal RNA small subunit methyltransferase D [Candidatus Thermoflexus japonica]